jgi:exopolyphosphatase / guanosine-5'-triphosphate,3'-diphosphate pyrophosphatase
MILAAIDIGSNAARLLITEVELDEKNIPVYNKLNLIRVPLRLGFDVFETGEISAKKTEMIVETMQSFKHLIKAYQVTHFKACATSAMRDAKNSLYIINQVEQATNIKINIITGDEEAVYIYENHVAENLDTLHSYLYIDVGGGSTELTFFDEGKMKYKESFNIGTIRLLKNMVTLDHWQEMKEHIKTNTKSKLPMIAIGSGGNINKIFSISKKKDGKPLSAMLLKDYYKEFAAYSLKERMKVYKMREDRADVLVPALQIYNNVMRWANIDEIYVPKIGLADGLIKHLYEEITHKNN